MAIAAAQPAINTLLKMGNGASPEVFNTVANVGDITGLSMSAAVVPTTSHSSAVPWVTRITTLLDGGDITLPIYFIPSSGAASGGIIGHNDTAGIMKQFTDRGQTTAGTPINWKLVFPDVAATTYAFTAFISKFTIKAPVAGVLTADITLSSTGQPTLV
jgi:hypothetical protein